MITNGIRVGGVKYQFLREDEGKCVYGKSKGQGAIAAQKTKTGNINIYFHNKTAVCVSVYPGLIIKISKSHK